MEKEYSNFNLKIKNLFLGLCAGAAGLPKKLRELAYTIHWIELNFENSEGKTVKPELIFFSDNLQNTVMLESKSGGNIEKEQYEKYSKVTADDLRTKAYVNRNCLEYIDTTYIVPEPVTHKAGDAFDKMGITCPLISVGLDVIKLYKNTFSREELTTLFKDGLNIKYEEIPSHFIPFDVESPKWVIAEKIVPIILAFLYENKSFFTTKDILEKIIPAWGSLGPAEQGDIEKKASEILRIAVTHEFKGFIYKNREITQRTRTVTWNVETNPLRKNPSKRSQAWKQLQNMQKAFIERLQKDKGQLDLFEKS